MFMEQLTLQHTEQPVSVTPTPTDIEVVGVAAFYIGLLLLFVYITAGLKKKKTALK